ncbi:uncharacterized protein LOC127742374 [Arachis duranensis]|uniref:Uncharacterized protein LOC127742374 n=1 Tax=Arachis duranensis TaxID=130453 RepID=A0A9C6THR5_ARADU|nr:uncharacterized protein LOC127742374 [Arachis duranensis]
MCISIRNLDGSRIVYPRQHTRSNSTGSTLISMDPRRPGALSRDMFRTGDVIPPFALRNTHPLSLVRGNTNGSPEYRTNSLGCPIYFASTAFHEGPVSQVDIGSLRRPQSPPVAQDSGSFSERIRR